MQFSLSEKNNDTTYYDINTTAYRLKIYVVPISVKEFEKIYEKFRYCRDRDGISFLLVYSTTDSKSACKQIVRTGKRGRPPRRVSGKKINGHVHSIILGTDTKSAYQSSQWLKKQIDKFFKRKTCTVESLGRGEHFYNTCGYVFRQADVVRTSGRDYFDFEAYYNSHNKYG